MQDDFDVHGSAGPDAAPLLDFERLDVYRVALEFWAVVQLPGDSVQVSGTVNAQVLLWTASVGNQPARRQSSLSIAICRSTPGSTDVRLTPG